MDCDYDYCLYNEDFICLLDKITVNSVGQCEECTIISLSKNDLKTMKTIQRISNGIDIFE